MNDDSDFMDPSSAGNFLHRYHQARNARSPPTTPKPTSAPPPTDQVPSSTPLSPTSRSRPIPPRRSDAAKSVWGSVFHPLGRSPTSASRYDLSPGQVSKPGFSASEIHAKGSGISLDEPKED